MKMLYCTNEPESPIDQAEIARLRSIGQVIVVCANDSPHEQGATDLVRLSCSPSRRKMTVLWFKLLMLISRLPDSNSAYRFPERNIYYKSWLFRTVINLIWKVKRVKAVNRLLPRFSTLAGLLPIRSFDVERRAEVLSADAVIYNSLPIMSGDFLPLVLHLRKCGARTIANVRSWDNPYYVQFDSAASDYLVWSAFMADSIVKAQGVEGVGFHGWGPNILKSFYDSQPITGASVARSPGIINIGYAAAFGDGITTFWEYRLVVEIAARLKEQGLACRILFRPYPTIDAGRFDIQGAQDIVMCDINSPAVDRYGDGREMIRYGSPEEKRRFLNSCDVFLSLGTTFTLEAVLQGTPAVHFYLPDAERSSPEEKKVFTRMGSTGDHFSDYFPGAIDFVESYEALARALASPSAGIPGKDLLLRRLGIDLLSAPDFLS